MPAQSTPPHETPLQRRAASGGERDNRESFEKLFRRRLKEAGRKRLMREERAGLPADRLAALERAVESFETLTAQEIAEIMNVLAWRAANGASPKHLKKRAVGPVKPEITDTAVSDG